MLQERYLLLFQNDTLPGTVRRSSDGNARKVFGNHEFDNGVDGLMKPFLENIQFPILGANIKADSTLASTFGITYVPYKIFTVGGQRVGVVGYTSQETPTLSVPGSTQSLRTR